MEEQGLSPGGFFSHRIGTITAYGTPGTSHSATPEFLSPIDGLSRLGTLPASSLNAFRRRIEGML
jgi:hypothetical protein